MYVTTLALRVRRRLGELFTTGEYVSPPVTRDPSDGSDLPQVVTILRRTSSDAALVVAPRFASRLASQGQWPIAEAVWAGSTIALPDDLASVTFTDVLTGARVTAENGRVRVADLLRDCPVAFAVYESTPERRV
jgi:maltooligosyltrehalose synthase